MNVRFIRFVIGSVLFFFAISEPSIVGIDIFGWKIIVPFFLRATMAFAGAYLLINVIQRSDEF